MLLANLFKPFDDAFVNTWNKARGNLSAPHVANLQKQLTELVQTYLCQDSNFADMHTNQQWLKSTVWQLTNGTVEGDTMSFQYPSNMSRDLLMSMASQFPGQGMELLNSGLIEKLMEMTHSMNEFLAMQPAPRDPFASGPRDHMSQLLNMVALSRNGDHRFLPVLVSKVAELLPKMVNPMLQNPPENPNMANIDIFDGFGNAGMAQPPPQMQMNMEQDYDRKFSVEEYDKKYAMEMNGATPESQTNSNTSPSAQTGTQQSSEMSNSFVSSPGIVSPGMDYSSNMNGFACTPMTEMVISPMGPPGHSTHITAQHQAHAQPQPQPQQQQHLPQGHDGMNQHHMSGMHSQNMNTASMATPHPINNMCAMQPPQRQNSFHLQAAPQMRTVGDFHGLQQASNDRRASMVGMGSMSSEIDFGALQ
jgi:hypothetical protein